MKLLADSSRRLFAGAVAAAALLLASPGYAQTGPFSALGGNWTGTGKIMIKDGGSERIRCRATYTIASAGKGLSQALRCASDSYRFDLNTTVTASGNSVSGIWSEISRNVNGTIGGRLSGSDIDALVEANGFAATLAMQMHGNKQVIAIRSQNTELRGVDITLSR